MVILLPFASGTLVPCHSLLPGPLPQKKRLPAPGLLNARKLLSRALRVALRMAATHNALPAHIPDDGYCLSRFACSTFDLSASVISDGPSFTVSLSILPVKRNGT